jgi:hypothetical protein
MDTSEEFRPDESPDTGDRHYCQSPRPFESDVPENVVGERLDVVIELERDPDGLARAAAVLQPTEHSPSPTSSTSVVTVEGRIRRICSGSPPSRSYSTNTYHAVPEVLTRTSETCWPSQSWYRPGCPSE